MSELTKFQKTHIWFSIVSSTVALASAAIAIWSFLQVGGLKQLYEDTRRLEMRMTISSPLDMATISGTPLPWRGKVEIRPTADSIFKGNTTLELAERAIRIVPFVRPLGSENLWWTQTAATIDANGGLSGSVNLGDSTGRGIGLDFQIVLVALPQDSVQQGQTFADIPSGSAQSPVLTVRRVQ